MPSAAGQCHKGLSLEMGLDPMSQIGKPAAMFPIRDHNPSGRKPIVTWLLIAMNIGIFLSYYPMGTEDSINEFFYTYGLIPAYLKGGYAYGTLISHMFLHGGWLHLAGNMLFLQIFGDNLEDELGHVGFLVFYLVCGLAAASAQIMLGLNSGVPMVGASGAIAGVMGGYLLLYPKAKVDVLFIFVIFFKVFSIRAWIVLLVWFAIQFFNGYTLVTSGDGVAYWAHVGGFVAGLLITSVIWLRKGGKSYWSANLGQPPHPEARYTPSRSHIPRVPRRKY